MNFGKFDVVILITMVIAVVCMSFVFPALGMTDDTEEDDLPEFQIESDRFDFAGDFPDRPGGPNHHYHSTDFTGVQHDPPIPIDDDDGQISTFIDLDEESEAIVVVEISTVDDFHTGELDEVGDVARFEEDGETGELDVVAELIELHDDDIDDGEAESVTEITIHSDPGDDDDDDDDGWISSIPVVSTAVDAGSGVAGMVGWIGSIINWGISFMFDIAANLIGMLYDTVTFQIDLITWLTGTYGDVVSAANSWASIFVAIPGILLFIELAKLVLIGISLLPTT